MAEKMTTRWAVPGYSSVRELGSGAAGTVLLALHEGTGRQVAVKYLADRLFDEPEFRAEFRREAQLLGEVDAPNVVRLYEYVESGTGAAIVMELVDGVSLRTLLDEQGPTEPESALAVLKGALSGLGAAHAVGVLHRDFKPANVLVTAEGASTLTDFGVAARAGGAVAEGSGTPWYMAPEQWAGAPPQAQCDIYAAAATLFECLAGEPPFPATDPGALRRLHEQAPVPVGALPVEVRGLVSRGMAKDPARRPPTAGVFLEELEAAALAGYGAGWEERGRRGLARRAALLALLFPLAGGGLAGGTAIATTVLGGGHRRRNGRIVVGAVTAAVLVLAAGGVAGVLGSAPVPARSQLPAANPLGAPPAALQIQQQTQPQVVAPVEPAPAPAVLERPAPPRVQPVALPRAEQPTEDRDGGRDEPAEEPPPPTRTDRHQPNRPNGGAGDDGDGNGPGGGGGNGGDAVPPGGGGGGGEDAPPAGGGGGGGGEVPPGGGGSGGEDVPPPGGGGNGGEDVPPPGGGGNGGEDVPPPGGGGNGGEDAPPAGGSGNRGEDAPPDDGVGNGGGDVPADDPPGGGDVPPGNGSEDTPPSSPTGDVPDDTIDFGGCACPSGDGPVVN
jgi:tRNA A-37 threonylcarbamoyl transferase component Bud32